MSRECVDWNLAPIYMSQIVFFFSPTQKKRPLLGDLNLAVSQTVTHSTPFFLPHVFKMKRSWPGDGLSKHDPRQNIMRSIFPLNNVPPSRNRNPPQKKFDRLTILPLVSILCLACSSSSIFCALSISVISISST